MLRGIVGIRLPLTRLEGKWKMSQNREPQDRAGVVQGFAARAEGDDLELAEMVRQASEPRS
jgi:transcriptional regulator